ncbi:MAG: CbiX/SirB N-terminal domain-containing protein [Clostridia bacterium]|nr:CbiX/SirB N-terminal domain-containing protein [Clostridia bacterium]
MEGIIILAHGSKREETEAILNSLVEKVKRKSGNELVCPAYLQFSKQNLETGVDRLAIKGAKKIKVVPMFLFDGVHVTEDIPKELVEIRSKYPGIDITMSQHIGDDDKLVDIILNRMNSTM